MYLSPHNLHLLFQSQSQSQTCPSCRSHFSPSAPPQIGSSLREAVKQFLAAKEKAGFRSEYVNSLRQVVGKFSLTIVEDSIGAAAVAAEAWVDAQAWGAAAKRSNIGRLASFFTFCRKRGWIAENPCDAIEMPRVILKTPFVFTAEDVAKIMAITLEHHPKMLAFATLNLILGLRPAEAMRTEWSNVDLENRRVIVDAAASKVHKRRAVPISDDAFAWLKEAKETGARLPVAKITSRRFIRAVRDALGLKAWPQDAMRHTAATMMLRKHEDAGKVARWMGNSERILLKHYADI